MAGLLPPLAAIPREVASVADYEALAAQRMSPQAWAYLSGGAADERTLARNRAAFDEILLSGRVLADMKGGDTKVTLFGQAFASPILLAPVAYHKLAHPDGERATALGAQAAEAGWVVSTHASVTMEEIAGAGNPSGFWFQLYAQPTRAATEELVGRAQRAGYRALVVTLDAPVNGLRHREQRAGFALPPGVSSVNTDPLPSRRAWEGGAGLCGGILEHALTWSDLPRLRGLTGLPLLLKGVLHPDDAVRALDYGVDGLVVSNHGGRTLDTLPASVEALRRIRARTGGKIPLLLDGGVRRGTDVVKALALGAQAVMVGRPYIHGLAAAGAVGVAHVVRLLRAELEVAMALTGCARLESIGPSVLWEADAARQ